MSEVAAHAHSRLHLEIRGLAGNIHVGALAVGEALTAEDVNSSKTSKFKTGTAISENLVAGSNASSIDPWFEVHQARWLRMAEKEVSAFGKFLKRWLEDNPEWRPSFNLEAKAP